MNSTDKRRDRRSLHLLRQEVKLALARRTNMASKTDHGPTTDTQGEVGARPMRTVGDLLTLRMATITTTEVLGHPGIMIITTVAIVNRDTMMTDQDHTTEKEDRPHSITTILTPEDRWPIQTRACHLGRQ